MYKIISVDLDGTLLSPNNKITTYTKKIIQLLNEQGFYFILSSGRHYIDMIWIQDILNIKTFLISSNGAQIYDLNRKLIFKKNFKNNIAKHLCEIRYFDEEIITHIYCNKNWYISHDKINNQFCPSLSQLKYQYFHPNNLNFHNINKIFFTSLNIKKMDDLEKEIINTWGSDITINYSMPGCLEVVSENISKGEGLKKISYILGLSLNDCISFGDGMNDEDMLRMSGKGCIMKNSDPRLKKVLPDLEIIKSNQEDGVAIFLYNKFIKNVC